MMLPDTSALMLTLLFFAVILLIEGAYFYYMDVHAPKSRVGSAPASWMPMISIRPATSTRCRAAWPWMTRTAGPGWPR